ncbi:MAG: hypothetical protein EU541_00390 [Promethearchaeota archaeon]|nr:MAG: hypothetical protein EU541_00390 [Candidatus Lokiarchaeota archaeon]
MAMLHLFNYFSFFFVLYLSIQVGKKIREDNLISTTTGFTFYLICYGIFIYTVGLPFIYSVKFRGNEFLFYHFIIMTVYFIGIIIFILLSELDLYYHSKIESKKPFPFLLSIIAIIDFLIYILLGIFGIYDVYITVVIIVIPYVIASQEILKNFSNLEIVKKQQFNWFYSGLAIAGLSNSLIGFYFMYGNIILIIKSILIIIGAILMVRSWESMPPLTELNWLQKMVQLLVIYRDTSSLIFKYNFKSDEETSKEQVDSDLAGSAIGGIDMLLGEILVDSGHIQEIDHANKKINFVHGEYTISILISTGSSKEFRYRLEMFHANLEKEYKEELEHFQGEITTFKDLETLIREYFLIS